jgi:hypothetical protein
LAIKKNLRQIFELAMVYMEMNGGSEVSYSQLVAGAKPQLNPLTPVAGENYDGLVVHQGDTSLTIDIPSQGPVTYEP